MIALGIDIGGTKIAAGLVRSDGRILDRTTVPTPAREGSSAILDVACTTAESLLDRSPDRVVGCGIGSAGVIDPDSGTVSSATSSLADWVGTDLRGGVRRRLGLPVRVLNDVHAHAVAEARLGAGAGANRMLLLALGTGIGGALVDAGRVDRGRHGAAGHFGHLRSPRPPACPAPADAAVTWRRSLPARRSWPAAGTGSATDRNSPTPVTSSRRRPRVTLRHGPSWTRRPQRSARQRPA